MPEVEEFFQRSDTESKEEAINKADERAQPGTGWTPAELNHILQAHVVDGSLITFWMCGTGV
jgi:hypothetical protein